MPTPQLFIWMAAAAILFLKDPSHKLIRSSEIPREQLDQNWMQSIPRSCPKAFQLAILENGRLWHGAPPPEKYIGRIAQSHRQYVENECVEKFIS